MFHVRTAMAEILDFLMGYQSNLRKPRILVSSRRCNRPENIVIRYVSFVSFSSLCTYLNLNAVDVFSFHLQIFHWFIAPPSRRYFQGHSP
jgi:hypothetical protein